MAAVDTLPLPQHIHDAPAHQAQAAASPVAAAQADLVSTVTYTQAPAPGEQLFHKLYQGEKPDGKPVTNTDPDRHQVHIRDLREAQQEFILQENGFQLEKLLVPNINWDDASEV